MRIYLSHHENEANVARNLETSLLGEGHEVLRRLRALPPGRTETERIENAIQRAQVFIVLLSSAAVAEGSWARLELQLARRRWRSRPRHLVPVLVEELSSEELAAVLTGLKPLEIEGSLAADLALHVETLGKARRRRWIGQGLISALVLVLFVSTVMFALHLVDRKASSPDASRFELRGDSIGKSLLWGEEAVFELAPVKPDSDLSFSCSVEAMNPNIVRVDHDPRCERIIVEAAYRPFVDSSGTPYKAGHSNPENDALPLIVFDAAGREIWRTRLPLILMNPGPSSFSFHGLPLDPSKDHSIQQQPLLRSGIDYPFEIYFDGDALPEGMECEHQEIPVIPGLSMLQVQQTGLCAFSVVPRSGLSPRPMPFPFKVRHPETGYQAEVFLLAEIDGEGASHPASQDLEDFSEMVDRVSKRILEDMENEP